MGKRKQKTNWSAVEDIPWTNKQRENTLETGDNSVENSAKKIGGGTVNGVSSIGPRFERQYPTPAKEGDSESVYYRGEICEAEHLPNGFTKIRQEISVETISVIRSIWFSLGQN